jgi:hypothetical protein
MELEIRKIETSLEGPVNSVYDRYKVDPYLKRKVSIPRKNKAQGFRTVEKIRISAKSAHKYTEHAGSF